MPVKNQLLAGTAIGAAGPVADAMNAAAAAARPTNPFAHLARPPASAARAEEREKDETAEEDKEKDDKEKAQDEEKDEEASASEDEEDEDEEDREELSARAPARATRLKERARCAAIFADPAAAVAPAMAAQLAFRTDLPRGQALGLLRAAATSAAPAKGKSGLAQRMEGAGAAPLAPSGGPAADTPEGLAASIIASYDRARGTKA